MPILSRICSRQADGPTASGRRWRPRGFTLLEVLMALTLLAVLLTGLYGSVHQSMRVQEIVEGERAVHHQIRLAAILLADELSAAYRDEAQSEAPFLGTMGGTGEARQDQLEFSALTEPDGLRRVRLFVERSRLIHEAKPDLAGTAETVELVEGVKALTLRYFDGSAWTDNWDALSKRLPAAVGLKVVVGGPDGRTWTFATAVDLPVGRRT